MDPPPVQFVTTSDGFSIAYGVSGNGRNVVFLPVPFNHIQHAWSFYPSWLNGLSERFRLIQYDSRGWGLSSRGLNGNYSLDDDVRDLEEVIRALNTDRVVLIGAALASHIAVRFATAFPERVEAIVMVASSLSADAWPKGMFEVLPRDNWDVFMEMLASRYHGDHKLRQLKASVTYEDWALSLAVHRSSDIEDSWTSERADTSVATGLQDAASRARYEGSSEDSACAFSSYLGHGRSSVRRRVTRSGGD